MVELPISESLVTKPKLADAIFDFAMKARPIFDFGWKAIG
jgi:uncharacterized protein (DUF2461 family)